MGCPLSKVPTGSAFSFEIKLVDSRTEESDSKSKTLEFKVLETLHREPSSRAAYVCPADGVYPDPLNCEFFYFCTQGTATRLQCLPGFAFDPATKICNQRSQVAACNIQLPIGGNSRIVDKYI